MIDNKLILDKIDQLEKNFEIMVDIRVLESYNYMYSMDQIEKKLDRLLIKVRNLVKENKLEEISFRDFKKAIIRLIHEEGMKRGEYDWVNSFEKKFGI